MKTSRRLLIILFALTLLPFTVFAQNWNTEVVATDNLGVNDVDGAQIYGDQLVIWVSGNPGFVRAYDISNPFDPVFQGQILGNPSLYVDRIDRIDNYLVISRSNDTNAYDVSTWDEPIPLGPFSPGRFDYLETHENYIYHFYNNQIHIYEIADMPNPPLVSIVSDLYFRGEVFGYPFIYIYHDGEDYVYILDVSDPNSPFVTNVYENIDLNISEAPYHPSLNRNTLYLQHYEYYNDYAYLVALDISNANNLQTHGSALGTYIFDEFYESFARDRGHIYDVSNPEQVILRGFLDDEGSSDIILTYGHYLVYFPRSTHEYNLVDYSAAIHDSPFTHFTPVPDNGYAYPIAIQSADFENIPLSVDDEIGVYDRGLCVGAARVTGQWPLTVVAWQQSPGGELPGFTEGYPIQLRIWKQSSSEEHPAAPTFNYGGPNFDGFGAGISHLAGWQESEQDIFIQGGQWELISFNLRPAWLPAENVFGSITPPLLQARNDRGQFYSPDVFGGMTIADPREGYAVICGAPTTLHVVGSELPPNVDLNLRAGRWNLLPYLLNTPIDPAVALVDIAEQVVLLVDDNGNFWAPGVMQTLDALVPGDAYRVWVNDAVTFQYNNGGIVQNRNIPVKNLMTPASAPRGSGLGWLVQVHVENDLLQRGADVVEILDDGTVVGSGYVDESGVATLIFWEGDSAHEVAGFEPGNEMQVRMRDAAGKLLTCEIDGAVPVFGATPITNLHVSADTALPTAFHVGQLTPNPFNPSFIMPLTLPHSGQMIVAVYDILGRQVSREHLQVSAGTMNYSFDAGARGLASGLYLVRVDYQGQQVVRKAMLLK
jgi:hypothetical protein